MLFFEFYKLQRLINDDEWDSFVDCLKSDLPTSFRIRGCHRYFFSFPEFYSTYDEHIIFISPLIAENG